MVAFLNTLISSVCGLSLFEGYIMKNKFFEGKKLLNNVSSLTFSKRTCDKA
jgi:hypothetical protein